MAEAASSETGVMCLKPFLFAGWDSEVTLPMPMPGKDTRKRVSLDFLRMLVPTRTEHIFFFLQRLEEMK